MLCQQYSIVLATIYFSFVNGLTKQYLKYNREDNEEVLYELVLHLIVVSLAAMKYIDIFRFAYLLFVTGFVY